MDASLKSAFQHIPISSISHILLPERSGFAFLSTIMTSHFSQVREGSVLRVQREEMLPVFPGQTRTEKRVQ
jgi:hypothetical protein